MMCVSNMIAQITTGSIMRQRADGDHRIGK